MRAEEVSGASGGGECGGEEAAGARTGAAAAGPQADHRLIRLHAFQGRVRPKSQIARARSRNRRAHREKIAEESKLFLFGVGDEGAVYDLSFG